MLSIIVPVYNEADSLPALYQEITQACAASFIEFELLFISDGSTDGSWDAIARLHAADPRVHGICFRRNFGKAAALTAGMEAARGDLILMMDADLQDDPIEIPKFLDKLADGFDVVNGWKVRRLDPWHKVYPSRVFNWMVSRLTGLSLHDHNCGFKLFKSEVTREIRLYGELHRFIPVLAHARGFRVSEIPVNHRKRQHGYSKYGFRRFRRGFLDLLTIRFLTGYGQRPQHLLGTWGLVFVALGMLGLAYLAALWGVGNVLPEAWHPTWHVGPIGTRPLLSYSIVALLLGTQLLSLGLLAELIVARTGQSSDTFSIAERLGRGA